MHSIITTNLNGILTINFRTSELYKNPYSGLNVNVFITLNGIRGLFTIEVKEHVRCVLLVTILLLLLKLILRLNSIDSYPANTPHLPNV